MTLHDLFGTYVVGGVAALFIAFIFSNWEQKMPAAAMAVAVVVVSGFWPLVVLVFLGRGARWWFRRFFPKKEPLPRATAKED